MSCWLKSDALQETEGRRDGGTERWSDAGTEGGRDEGTEGPRDGKTGRRRYFPSLFLSVSLSPRRSVAPRCVTPIGCGSTPTRQSDCDRALILQPGRAAIDRAMVSAPRARS